MACQKVSNARVHGIDFTVREGEIITLIGPSGSGKSSLLFLFNRLMDPDEGEVYWYGKPLSTYPVEEVRQKIGMVFQSSSLFDGSVEENLKFGPSLRGEWDQKLGISLLNQVDLPESYLGKNADQLSGGEQQRVAFARTLANKPEVLLLDEVTSALDVKSVEIVEELIRSLMQDHVKAVLMVTHDIKQAKRLGDWTIYMEEGRIIEQGKTKSMLSNPSTYELSKFMDL
ncbi:ABC transporter ATP-binding protein [Salisediminibacterium beveridgei]|nr:phosphate ABC transporter ATP-binding protein [Salisediminibacterium beveridgei]